MKIGIFLEGELTIGGGFQQELTTARLIKERGGERFEVVVLTDSVQNRTVLAQHNLPAEMFRPRMSPGLEEAVLSNRSLARLGRKTGILRESQLDRICVERGIDLVYFLATSNRSLMLQKTPYLITVWDLCHRDHPEFPEVRQGTKFAKREHVLRTSLPRATAVVVDSELGKSNLCRRYGIDPDKVVVLPFQPSHQATISETDYRANYIDIKRKYGIDGDYIFYPAQFWAHKNHVYILEGLRILKERHGTRIAAVFCGSDRGNLAFILEQARRLGVGDQVKHIGFVDGKELPYLYRQALALVMPTYFGPTNIPPLEAFANDCPVLYSDLEGMREQVSSAALLMDLADPTTMAENVLRVMVGGTAIDTLKVEGRKLVRDVSDEAIWAKLLGIFVRVEAKTRTWKAL